ncbi:MAG: Phosphate regulon transcriptional regulatory protein PhoB (SphR) [Acidimicrobiales bacterium]|jgi:DNA-binding response OmpR family regulator|nr:Phosphate regulon transcriptional regulatory protein PhoB (SphR) [Acidimicrobiales bacterium]
MALVLAVDDEDDILEIIRVNLELEGHRVVVAHNGHEALAQASEHHPDVVLLDVMMPGMDGWEVLTRLKADAKPEMSEVPVLMLTARAADEDRVRGGIEGAIRYLTKPFLPDLLVEEVAAALEGDREPVKRRAAQREALSQLARIEKGSLVADTSVRPHLTRLERAPEPEPEPPRVRAIREKLVDLSEKQRHLLAVLRATPSVSQAAGELDVSRSNVYASLRRISRKLGTQSVPELLALVREGDLLRDVG